MSCAPSAPWRSCDPAHEGLGARAGDGAERLDHLVPAHADAVVLDREPAALGVDQERDPGLGIIAEQGRVGDRLEAQPLTGVGRVGDQLAQKDVPVGIDRVHHQLQQLGDVRLEGAALGGDGICGRHGWCSSPSLAGGQMGEIGKGFKPQIRLPTRCAFDTEQVLLKPHPPFSIDERQGS